MTRRLAGAISCMADPVNKCPYGKKICSPALQTRTLQLIIQRKQQIRTSSSAAKSIKWDWGRHAYTCSSSNYRSSYILHALLSGSRTTTGIRISAHFWYVYMYKLLQLQGLLPRRTCILVRLAVAVVAIRTAAVIIHIDKILYL